MKHTEEERRFAGKTVSYNDIKDNLSQLVVARDYFQEKYCDNKFNLTLWNNFKHLLRRLSNDYPEQNAIYLYAMVSKKRYIINPTELQKLIELDTLLGNKPLQFLKTRRVVTSTKPSKNISESPSKDGSPIKRGRPSKKSVTPTQVISQRSSLLDSILNDERSL